MWGKLNINVVENNIEITKNLYYNSNVIKNEDEINNVIESLLDNKECKGAFLVDEWVADYITSMCQEAYNAGKASNNEIEEKYENLKYAISNILENFQ